MSKSDVLQHVWHEYERSHGGTPAMRIPANVNTEIAAS
jgi:hypothetical protein